MRKFRGLITNFLGSVKSIGAGLGLDVTRIAARVASSQSTSPMKVIRQRILANFDYDKFYAGFIEIPNIVNWKEYANTVDLYPITMLSTFQYFDDNLPCELVPQDPDEPDTVLKDLRTPLEKLIIEIRKRVNAGTHGNMITYAFYEAGLRCYFARTVSERPIMPDRVVRGPFVKVLQDVYGMLLKNSNDLGRDTLDLDV